MGHHKSAPPPPVPGGECITVVISFWDEEFPYRTKIPGKQPTLKQFKEYLPRKGTFRWAVDRIINQRIKRNNFKIVFPIDTSSRRCASIWTIRWFRRRLRVTRTSYRCTRARWWFWWSRLNRLVVLWYPMKSRRFTIVYLGLWFWYLNYALVMWKRNIFVNACHSNAVRYDWWWLMIMHVVAWSETTTRLCDCSQLLFDDREEGIKRNNRFGL